MKITDIINNIISKVNEVTTHKNTIGNPHGTAFSDIESKPTTVSGYGLTDVYTETQVQESLPAIGLDTTNITPPTIVGQMKWNEDEGTVDLAVYGAVLQLGQGFVVKVRNNTGSTITNGTVVMATGSVGNSGRITVAPHNGTVANATSILGITTHDITNGSDGIVTILGKVEGINTTGSTVGETWVDGTKLYVKPDDGGRLTSMEPSDSETKMSVAYVVNAHTNGTLYVRVLGFDENHYKEWVQSKLGLKVDTSVLANFNVFRADKVLATKDIVKLVYDTGNLVKIRYTNDTDIDYEVLTYVDGDLTNVAHYLGGVLQGNTVLTYSDGDLLSSRFIGV